LYEPNITGSEPVIHFKVGLSPKIIKKMKQGNIDSPPSIDLHGHKIEEACQSLSRFIHFHSNERFIHIIHGKGYHSNNGLSIIKSQVVHYLKQHPQVLAFCSCPQDMGGTGAVFVHLRADV
jgi:DNA-nicking Smr family endonuclease